jgi:hypothetical protein
MSNWRNINEVDVNSLGLQIIGVIKTNWKLFHVYLKILNIRPISHIIAKKNNNILYFVCDAL